MTAYWLGKKRGPHSEETKAKMRAAAVGKPKSAEHRVNIAVARLGAKHTEESKEKNRLAHLGRRHRPESIEKMRAAVVRGPEHQWWGHTNLSGPRTRWVRHNGIALRSSYELRLARAFDALGVAWIYEPERFDLGECTYLPDFYLPDTGSYWEVKGWLDPASLRRIRLFRERHPDKPLILADNAVITLMERLAS